MQYFLNFIYLYLFLGFIYAIYVTFWASARWYLFPINLIGGPIAAVHAIIKAIKEEGTNL